MRRKKNENGELHPYVRPRQNFYNCTSPHNAKKVVVNYMKMALENRIQNRSYFSPIHREFCRWNIDDYDCEANYKGFDDTELTPNV